MAETIKVPAFGEQKKSTVYIVGGLVVVVVAVGYYRSKKAAASAVPSGPGIDSTSIDPATGFAYGSPEDAAALNSQAGYIQPAQYGYGGGTDTSTGVITQPTAGGFVSNAQWTQAAEAYAETLGSDVTSVASALGHYLAGDPLSPGQVDLVQQAIASQGYPPQAGINGYPPSYRTATASKPPTTQPTKPSSPATPKSNPLAGYSFYYDSNTGYYYDVNLSRKTVHHLTGAQLAADRRLGSLNAITVKGRPVFRNGHLVIVDTKRIPH